MHTDSVPHDVCVCCPRRYALKAGNTYKLKWTSPSPLTVKLFEKDKITALNDDCAKSFSVKEVAAQGPARSAQICMEHLH